jgi:hypothetical protein
MAGTAVLTGHGHFRETILKMEAVSRKFETLARGVLDECHRENADRASKILRVKMDNFRLLQKTNGVFLDCIDMAVEAMNLEFMSHPACQAQLEEEWSAVFVLLKFYFILRELISSI